MSRTQAGFRPALGSRSGQVRQKGLLAGGQQGQQFSPSFWRDCAAFFAAPRCDLGYRNRVMFDDHGRLFAVLAALIAALLDYWAGDG